MKCCQCMNDSAIPNDDGYALCAVCAMKRVTALSAAKAFANGDQMSEPASGEPNMKAFTTWWVLRDAISRLETVEYRLRHGAYMGMRWKFLRREYEANIIANEVIPAMKRLLAEQNVSVSDSYPERMV